MFTSKVELALCMMCLAVLPGCIVGTCSFDMLHAEVEIVSPEHVAIFSIRSSGGHDIEVEVGGTLENQAEDVDCPTAVYRFETEPHAEDLPVISFEVPAPETLNGDGFLLLETVLPAIRRGTRVPRDLADLPSVHRGDGAFERWLAITTCGEARVDADLLFDTGSCERRNREPPAFEITRL